MDTKQPTNEKTCHELVIRPDDKIEYSTKEIVTEVSLFEKLLNSKEFCRAPTKEVVLDEDDYLGYIEEIITRDYYPSLYEMTKNTQVNLIIKGFNFKQLFHYERVREFKQNK